ncbi:chloride channel protein [Methylobacterium sp. J-076]|uniref:chloride channel protein n=1 Tax=Methylobacterium sp. J-076 TaxID=2836655 RepID=UPI001FBB640F|nr:chloride channel protein [Methylobacterium sp. J-076]MCJ2013322.1 chloride channel protein [Methylobacterium sp. J-076]
MDDMTANATGRGPVRCTLSDFTVDRRILLLTGMAVIVGSLAVGAAWVLLALIGLATNLAWFGRFDTALVSLAAAPRGPWMVAIPVIGALIVGVMARYGSEKIRGHGIPEAMEAILIGGSRMSPKVALLKPLSSAIAIGSGGPFGAEGPIIVTGGAIGSLYAQFFQLSAIERRTLLVSGAAAGMTAIFGTPVAALLLALEVLLFEWRPRSLVPVAVAAATAMAWRPFLFETGPLFPFADNPALPWWGLLACVGLGLACGLLSGLLTRLLYGLEDAFRRLPIHWMWWPALGAVVVGLGGLIEPRALGVGYDVIRGLLDGHFATAAVATILAVKAAIWLVALASGTSGGVLAPLLILGGAFGSLAGLALPGSHGFWALLGMAAMLGGTLPAPLTGIVFAVEVTGDAGALAPLLAATMAAYAVSVLLLKRSILTEKIARRGHHVTREYGIDAYEFTRVGAVMTREVETLAASSTLAEAAAAVQAGRHDAYPVMDEARRPVGLVSRADILLWMAEEDRTAGDTLSQRIADAPLPAVHPGDVVSHALDVMLADGSGRLVVTDPASGALAGILTRRDLLRIRAESVRAEGERQAYLRRRR